MQAGRNPGLLFHVGKILPPEIPLGRAFFAGQTSPARAERPPGLWRGWIYVSKCDMTTDKSSPASPLLSDVARQLLIMFGLENFSRAKPPAEGPLAAEPLKDDQGQQVFAPDHQRKKGEEERNVAVMRPAFMDPHFFVRKGIEDRKRDEEALKYAGESGMLLFALTYGLIDTNLFNFDHGGPWDAQRISGHYYEKYVEYATIALGLYAAAYGIPEDKILELENMTANIDFLIALTEGRVSFPDREMDKIYRYLPEDNVKWTDIGYELYKSGKISPNSKP